MKFIQTFLSATLTQQPHCFWLPRFFGLLLLPGFIFDTEILLLFQALIFLHALLGLEAILEDYLHVEVIKYQYFSLVKLFSILLINLNILYLL